MTAGRRGASAADRGGRATSRSSRTARAGSRADEGFLRVRRLVLRTVFADGAPLRALRLRRRLARARPTRSPSSLYEVDGDGRAAGARCAWRSRPACARRCGCAARRRSTQPDARRYGALAEIVAGHARARGRGPRGRRAPRRDRGARGGRGRVDPPRDVRAARRRVVPEPGHHRREGALPRGRGVARARSRPPRATARRWRRAAASSCCRSTRRSTRAAAGEIPDMKTEVALLRLARRARATSPRSTASSTSCPRALRARLAAARPRGRGAVRPPRGRVVDEADARRRGRARAAPRGGASCSRTAPSTCSTWATCAHARGRRGAGRRPRRRDQRRRRGARVEGPGTARRPRGRARRGRRGASRASTSCTSSPAAPSTGCLEALRPHVHAKGREYDRDDAPRGATNRRRLGIQHGVRRRREDARDHRRSLARAARRGPPSLDRRARRRRTTPACAALVLPARREALRAARAPRPRDAAGRRTARPRRGRPGARRREVRRIEAGGTTVYVKAERAASRRGTLRGEGPIAEMRSHLALRAAGLRAPEPWLALEGKDREGRRAGALVTREAAGTPLDAFLRGAPRRRAPRASAPRGRAGSGVSLRALHTARFLHPDLHARHLVVDGDPAGGPASITLDRPRAPRAREEARRARRRGARARGARADSAPVDDAAVPARDPARVPRRHVPRGAHVAAGDREAHRARREALDVSLPPGGPTLAGGARPMKPDGRLEGDPAALAALAARRRRDGRRRPRARRVRARPPEAQQPRAARGRLVVHVKRTKSRRPSAEAAAIRVGAAAGVPVPRIAFEGVDAKQGSVVGTLDLAPARPLDDLLARGPAHPRRDATPPSRRSRARRRRSTARGSTTTTST